MKKSILEIHFSGCLNPPLTAAPHLKSKNRASGMTQLVSPQISFIFLLGCLTLCFMHNTHAGGFETYFIGARGKVLGGALTGIADDSSAVYYNPAGLATLKPDYFHWEVSASTSLMDFEYKDNHDNQEEYNSSMIKVLPSIFASKNVSDNLACGFGIYVPWGGGGVDYGKTSVSQPIRDGYLGLIAFTPALSYKIASGFSIGMGLSGYYGIFDQTLVIGREIKEEFSGYAGYNAHFGVLLKPMPQLKVGMIARTPTDVSLDGTSNLFGIQKQDATVEFTIPAKVSIGLSYQVTDSLLLATNFSYFFYDDFDELATKYQSGVVLKKMTGFKNYIDTAVAFEYRGLEKLSYRGSIRYSASGTQNEYINAFTNDVDYMLFDAGIGYLVTDNLELMFNFGYNWGFHTENINGTYDAYQISSQIGLRTVF